MDVSIILTTFMQITFVFLTTTTTTTIFIITPFSIIIVTYLEKLEVLKGKRKAKVLQFKGV